MNKINIKKPINIHFIGIGGISMSSIAQIFLKNKFKVSGSDITKSDKTSLLENLGAKISIGHKKENITKDIDLVVYTSAIKDDNEELQTTKNLKIPLITRAELLGELMSNYTTSIAISGTHGKTTTTSIISHILLKANFDPTIMIGGDLKLLKGNLRLGRSSDIFVTEACEYTNSFLKFKPTIGIILNIEEDHLDFFKDIDDIRKSFNKFAQLLPNTGTLIINGEIKHINKFINNLNCKVITFGIDKNYDYSARNIVDNINNQTFDLYKKNKFIKKLQINIPGRYNILNFLSSIVLSDILNISLKYVEESFKTFKNADRRFEYKGKFNQGFVIDDYAHHPTEITETLKTAKKYPHNKLWVVFQPHTYSRTKNFLKDFAKSLSIADNIIITKIFAAREKNTFNISEKFLINELSKLNKKALYIDSFEKIKKFLIKNFKKDDLLITMGAGDIYKLANSIIK